MTYLRHLVGPPGRVLSTRSPNRDPAPGHSVARCEGERRTTQVREPWTPDHRRVPCLHRRRLGSPIHRQALPGRGPAVCRTAPLRGGGNEWFLCFWPLCGGEDDESFGASPHGEFGGAGGRCLDDIEAQVA